MPTLAVVLLLCCTRSPCTALAALLVGVHLGGFQNRGISSFILTAPVGLVVPLAPGLEPVRALGQRILRSKVRPQPCNTPVSAHEVRRVDSEKVGLALGRYF